MEKIDDNALLKDWEEQTMPKMNLDRVTLTGADSSTDPNRLATMSAEFPFVEWGILLSGSQSGAPRFPSLKWLASLYSTFLDCPDMVFSFHVCGNWVREICAGNWTPLFANIGKILDFGKRIQLNFHADRHLLSADFVPKAIARCQNLQVIFQCDGVNDHLVSNVHDNGLNAVPLYDKSGGAGVVPDKWPKATKGIYSGYAGGLGPDNVASELEQIAIAANGGQFWLDMETNVRSPDNQQFDLAACQRCLEICAPHISTPPRSQTSTQAR